MTKVSSILSKLKLGSAKEIKTKKGDIAAVILHQEGAKPLLKPGDDVGIFLGGLRSTKEDFMSSVDLLKSWGLKPVVDEKILNSKYKFLYGNGQETAEHFYNLTQKTNRIISFSGKGGKSVAAPYLQNIKFDNPDLFLFGGFSNDAYLPMVTGIAAAPITHLQYLAYASIPQDKRDPKNLMDTPTEQTLEAAKSIMFDAHAIQIPNLKSLNSRQQLVLNAPVVGGNISVLVHSLAAGTFNVRGKILMIEQYSFEGHDHDRNFNTIIEAAQKHGALAVIIGQILPGKKEEKELLEQTIATSVAETSLPIFRGGEFGHGGLNCPPVLNRKSILMPQEDGKYSLIGSLSQDLILTPEMLESKSNVIHGNFTANEQKRSFSTTAKFIADGQKAFDSWEGKFLASDRSGFTSKL